MRKPLTNNIAQAICAAILILFGMVMLFCFPNILSSDFAAYYTAATVVNNGDGSSLYNTDVQKAVQSRLIFPYRFAEGKLLPFEYPPWAVLPFVPLAWLPLKVGYFVWFCVNAGLFLVALRIVTSALPAISSSTNRLATMWLAAASFFPLFIALFLGQLTIVVFLGYALCFVALKKGYGFRAGLALAFALVKPQLIIALPLVLLYKRRWRALLGLASGLAGLVVASVLIVGIPRLDDYISIFQYAEEYWGCAGLSWRGLFCPLDMGLFLSLIMSVLSVVLLLFAWRDREHKTASLDLRYALAISMTLLISPHLYSHDLTLLILPAFLAVNHAFPDKIGASARGPEVIGVVAWVGVGYLVGLLRLFPDFNIFGVRPETLFLIAISLALAKAILLPGSSDQRTLI